MQAYLSNRLWSHNYPFFDPEAKKRREPSEILHPPSVYDNPLFFVCLRYWSGHSKPPAMAPSRVRLSSTTMAQRLPGRRVLED